MTSVSADRPGAREEPGEEELSRLEALADCATVGPWGVDGPWWHDRPLTNGETETYPAALITAGTERRPVVLGLPVWAHYRDAPTDNAADLAFIAECRDAVPALIASLRSARAERDEALARTAAATAIRDFPEVTDEAADQYDFGYEAGYNVALRGVRAALGAATAAVEAERDGAT